MKFLYPPPHPFSLIFGVMASDPYFPFLTRKHITEKENATSTPRQLNLESQMSVRVHVCENNFTRQQKLVFPVQYYSLVLGKAEDYEFAPQPEVA